MSDSRLFPSHSVVSDEWELLNDLQTRTSNAPSADPSSDVVRSLDAEREAVFAWLETHAPILLANPLDAAEGELASAVNEGIAQRSLSQSQAKRLYSDLMAQLVGAGDLEPYMRDDAITEIMVTGMDVFIERDGRIERTLPLANKKAAIHLAQHLCRHCRVEYHQARTLYNLTWPENGARMNLVHHSVAPIGTAITIRKRNSTMRLDLPDLLAGGMLTPEAAELLIRAIQGQLNVVLSGSTGTGKTTVLRALAGMAIDPRERLLVLEDTEELRLPLPHQVVLIGPAEVSADQRRQGIVSLQDLFRNTLRMRGDRLIMGELRGPEAFDFIEAGLTDQGGLLTTVHIRRPDLLTTRLYWIAQKNALDIPYDLIRESVYQAIDLIVQIDRDGDGRRYVSAIVETAPEGRVVPLFTWDPQARRLERHHALSPARQQWMAQYQAQRHGADDTAERIRGAMAEAAERLKARRKEG